MENSELPKKILLIDDDSAVGEALIGAMSKNGVQMVRAIDLDTAMYQFNQQMFDLIVVELEFGPLPGLALVQKFRQTANEQRRQAGIVLLSGQSRKNVDEGLVAELGDIEVVSKPATAIKLLPALARALQNKVAVAAYEQVRSLCYAAIKNNAPLEAIEICKTNMPKLQMKGMALMCSLYEEAGMLGEALQITEVYLTKKPDDISMNNARGRIFLKQGDLVKAKQFLEKADAAAPLNLERIKAMAAMYLQLDDPNASVEKMKLLIELNPENKEMKFDLFRDLEKGGFVEHAVGLCKETTLPTEVVRYYNNKGVMLSKVGQNAEAIAEYRSSLKFYPSFRENYRILFNIAIAEVNQKTPESTRRAEAALVQCLDLQPNFDKAKALLANVQHALAAKSVRAS